MLDIIVAFAVCVIDFEHVINIVLVPLILTLVEHLAVDTCHFRKIILNHKYIDRGRISR